MLRRHNFVSQLELFEQENKSATKQATPEMSNPNQATLAEHGTYWVTILDAYHSHIYHARIRVQPTALSLVIQSPLPAVMVNEGQYALLGNGANGKPTYLTQIDLPDVILFKFDKPKVKIYLRSIFHSYKIILSMADYASFRADCQLNFGLKFVDQHGLERGALMTRVWQLQQSCYLLNREIPFYYEVVDKTSLGDKDKQANALAVERIKMDMERDHQDNMFQLGRILAKGKAERVHTLPDRIVLDDLWLMKAGSDEAKCQSDWHDFIETIYMSKATVSFLRE